MNETFPRYSDLTNVFKSEDFLNRPDEELKKDLQALCVENNKNTIGRDTIRALTINHIQLSRTIKRLNTQNTLLIILTVFIATYSAYLQWQLYKMSQNQLLPQNSTTLQTNTSNHASSNSPK